MKNLKSVIALLIGMLLVVLCYVPGIADEKETVKVSGSFILSSDSAIVVKCGLATESGKSSIDLTKYQLDSLTVAETRGGKQIPIQLATTSWTYAQYVAFMIYGPADTAYTDTMFVGKSKGRLTFFLTPDTSVGVDSTEFAWELRGQ